MAALTGSIGQGIRTVQPLEKVLDRMIHRRDNIASRRAMLSRLRDNFALHQAML
ncbi:hypothetical protein PGT21_020516 [Puccinia graminis f. sp. tritici]|uniref:Uncharacterized protein n=1 Tax=Puccinia graminis f. sp. tritici TaxID=56615 RepID=A0A5B0PQG4_PUCGR|nr:hypothetical protein PGT21_020516 [Puccinia graminis f. sp. tritici]